MTPNELDAAEAVEQAMFATEATPGFVDAVAHVLAAEVRRLRAVVDRLSEKNTNQGLALAQAEHGVALLADECDRAHAQLRRQAPLVETARVYIGNLNADATRDGRWFERNQARLDALAQAVAGLTDGTPL